MKIVCLGGPVDGVEWDLDIELMARPDNIFVYNINGKLIGYSGPHLGKDRMELRYEWTRTPNGH